MKNIFCSIIIYTSILYAQEGNIRGGGKTVRGLFISIQNPEAVFVNGSQAGNRFLDSLNFTNTGSYRAGYGRKIDSWN
jgi:hypothetical protein